MKKKHYGIGMYVGDEVDAAIQIIQNTTEISKTSFFLECSEDKADYLYDSLKKVCKCDIFNSIKSLEPIPNSIWINCVPGNIIESIGKSFGNYSVGILLDYNGIQSIKELISLSISGGISVIPTEVLENIPSNDELVEVSKISSFIVRKNSIPNLIVEINNSDSYIFPKHPKSHTHTSVESHNTKENASIIINDKMVVEEVTDELDQYFLKSNKLIGKKITRLSPLFGDEIWESIINYVSFVLNNDVSLIKEYRESGASYCISIKSLKSRNDNRRILLNFADSTINTQLTQDLERSEAKFKLFFQNAPVGKSILTTEGKYLKVNKSFANMMGYTREEMVEMTYADFTHPDDLENSRNSMSILLEGKTKEFRFQKRYIGKDGQIIWTDVSISLFYSATGKPLFFLTNILDISRRMEVEKAMEVHLAKTLAMFDAINEVVYVSDPNSHELVYTNETFNKLVNAHKIPLGKKCYEVIQGKNEPCSFCTNKIIFEDKPHETYVWEFQNPITKNWYRCADKAIDWIDGRKLRMELAIDITKEVEYRRGVEKSQERYALATAASNNGIWDWWTDSHDVFYSDQWKAQLGYKPEELENNFKTWEDLLHPDDKERMLNRVGEFLQNPDDYFLEEFRMIHKDGTPRWIHNKAAAVLNEQGKVLRMMGAHSDITELKEAEEELRKTDLMYRGIIENAPDGVVMINMNNKFSFVSNSALRMFGFDKEDVLNTDPAELTHPDDLDKIIILLKEMLSEGGSNSTPTAEYRFKHANGDWKWIESTFSMSRDEDGKDAIVINFRDINERKVYERKLLEAKKKAEDANIHKNYFLANMSHEIRTPMNGVIGFSDLLKDDNITQDQRKKYLEVIDSNAKQLLSLIDDIIDVAKIESNELKIHLDNCDIIDLLNDALFTFNEIKKQKGKDDLNLVLHIPEDLNSFTIKCDCNRLMQIFYNLIGNALKFSEVGNIEFGFSVDNNRINFFVKDEGIGIPPDKLEEIFDRFKQLNYDDVVKYGGTGLGLSICKGIIKLFGGEIKVDSEIGKGTSFSFWLPYNPGEIELIDMPDPELSAFDSAVDGKKILLAEDDPIVGMYFEEIFRPTNATLLWATDGKGAVEIFKEHSDISLVLMDIRMPEMNGYKAAQEILKINPQAKIIIQTAYAMQDERQKCFDAGCIDYMAKPIVKSELERRMPTWLVGKN